MSTDRSEASYDLDAAAALSRRLTRREAGEPRPRTGETPEEPPRSGYVQFTRERLRFGARRAAPSEAPLEVEVEVPWSPEMMGSAGWRHLVDWCVEALDADAVFVVDGSGLVVAGSGMLASGEVEAAGARLLALLELADRLLESQGRAVTLSVELELGWLVGLRVPVGSSQDGDHLAVGIVTPRPLSAGARKVVLDAFAKKALGI